MSHLLVISKVIECRVEIYHYYFCDFRESIRPNMEEHYYHRHEKELKYLGDSMNRKIDRTIINGNKSFIASSLKLKE